MQEQELVLLQETLTRLVVQEVLLAQLKGLSQLDLIEVLQKDLCLKTEVLKIDLVVLTVLITVLQDLVATEVVDQTEAARLLALIEATVADLLLQEALEVVEAVGLLAQRVRLEVEEININLV